MIVDLDNQDSILYHRRKYSEDDGITGNVGFTHVIGYHCTKLIDNSFVFDHGLRLLDLMTHKECVLKLLCDHGLSQIGIEIYKETVNTFLNSHEYISRSGRIWFVLNKSLCFDAGCKDFFRFYGGEVIYRLFRNNQDSSEIIKILASIGVPKIIKCKLKLSNMLPYQRGTIVNIINGSSQKIDACSTVAISADDIIDVQCTA